MHLFEDNGALFSPCRRYRYTLWRIWDPDKPFTAFICLNPSTADEAKNDPTVTRCIRFSRDWGFGGYYMLNIFAFRATDPKVMKAEEDPVGPENDRWLSEIAANAGIAIAAWGVHGVHMNRGQAVLEMLPELYHLGLTKDGLPRHPLYLRADMQPTPFEKG